MKARNQQVDRTMQMHAIPAKDAFAGSALLTMEYAMMKRTCLHEGETSTYCTKCWVNLYELRQRGELPLQHSEEAARVPGKRGAVAKGEDSRRRDPSTDRRHTSPPGTLPPDTTTSNRSVLWREKKKGGIAMAKSERTLWGPTIQVNFMRGLASGVTALVLSFALGGPSKPGEPSPWLFPVAVPLAYLFLFVPLGYVAELVGRIGIPFGGLFQLPALFFGMLGDPVLYVLHRLAPPLVPADELKFINFAYGIKVFAGSETQAAPTDAPQAQKRAGCPFAGRVMVDKETTVLGFNWPTKAIAFHIRPDWIVTEPNGREFGWVDVKGVIHNGLPLSGPSAVDPREILAGDVTGVRIHGELCWNGDEKVGSLWKF